MTDINVGQLSEAINGKMDRDGSNIASPKLPVFLVAVQYPTSSNGYTWYRKYSDGWVEQGGYIAGNATDWDATVVYPIAMANTNYTILCQAGRNDGSGTGINNQAFIHTYTTTGCVVDLYGDGKTTIMWWQVSGMAAS